MSATPLTRIRRESDVLRIVDVTLRERMPPGWTVDLSPGERVGGGIADAVLTVRAPDGSRVVAAVEAKLRLNPRDLDSVLRQVHLLTVNLPEDGGERGAPLVVARFLSRRVRAELADRGVNYADATGNLRLVFSTPGLFVEAAGADRDPLPEQRALRSLRGPAAARIVRALFDAETPLTVRELAERSGASLGSSSRVVELLNRERVIERDSRGSIRDVNRTGVIERWADDYSFVETNVTALYLEPRRLERLMERLRDARFLYAITGSLAARLISEHAQARLAMVYVDDIAEAGDALGLTPVDAGGNVLLAEPFDSVVYDGAWMRDGVRYAAPAQVAADLLTSPGRGPAEGEELLRALEAKRRA